MFVKRKLIKLPPSAKFVYWLISEYGPLSRRELEKISLMPQKTIGYALNTLLRNGLIFKEKKKNRNAHVLYYVNQ